MLPGQFLATPKDPTDNFMQSLKTAILGFAHTPPVHNSSSKNPPTGMPEALKTCKFVLVRRDGQKSSLQLLYDGPYLVLARDQHKFRLQLGEREEVVSVERLKPVTAPPETERAAPPQKGVRSRIQG